MAQFDVHRNTGASKGRYPYLVVVQSEMLRRWRRRVVVPLAITGRLDVEPDPRLNPVIIIEGEPHYLAAHEITNVPVSALGEVVADLRDEATTVLDAIDWMMNQGFGCCC